MFTIRNIVIAAIAGVVGCIANALAVAAIAGAPLLPLIVSPGRQFFSILFALALIPLFARMSGAAVWIAGIVVLTLLASVSAKWGFGAAAPWGLVLGVNAVYAIAATLVYAVSRRG